MQSRQLLFGIGITLARGLIHPRPKGAGFSLPLDPRFYKHTQDRANGKSVKTGHCFI